MHRHAYHNYLHQCNDNLKTKYKQIRVKCFQSVRTHPDVGAET